MSSSNQQPPRGTSPKSSPENLAETSATPGAPPRSPAAAPSPVAAPMNADDRDLIQAIPDRLEVPSAGSAYSFELCAVAGLMVLLPVLYVAIIAAVGWGVVWHFQHNTWLLSSESRSSRGRGGLLLLLAYVAPGVVGLGLFITLLKPLFAGWWDDEDHRTRLDRSEQPLLFAFVDRLCDSLGSPRPHAIYVDEQANASAGLVGVSGLVTNRLQLTVGLPLVAGMPLKNLAGILAHEFGHFSQYWGMRLSNCINLVNAWFAHVVHHRDSLDEWIATAARSLDLRIGWVLYLVMFANWLVRLLLRGLQGLGLLFSRRLMWQMEYHADTYEAELAGSETFRSTFTRLGLISAASEIAREEFGHFAARKQLVDNFTLFTTGQLGLLKPEVRRAVRAHLNDTESDWSSTHPASKDRIRIVEEAGRPGVFDLEAPATSLFRDFEQLCRAATRQRYTVVLGRPVEENELTSAEMLVDELEETAQGLVAARRFVGGEACAFEAVHPATPRQWSPEAIPATDAAEPMWIGEAELFPEAARAGEAAGDPADATNAKVAKSAVPVPSENQPVSVPGETLPQTAAEWLVELRTAREGQRSLQATLGEWEERVRNSRTDLRSAVVLEAALQFKLDPAPFQPDRDRPPIQRLPEATRFLQCSRTDLKQAVLEREPHVRAWSRRLWAALGLLATPESARKIPGQPRLVAERDRIWPTVIDLSRGSAGQAELSLENNRLTILILGLLGGREDQALVTEIQAARVRVYDLLKDCFRELAQTPYPEAIEPKPDSLGRACFPGITDPENPGEVVTAAGEFLGAVEKHWERAVGQAVLLANRVEAAWGLEPLPEVTPSAAKSPTQEQESPPSR